MDKVAICNLALSRIGVENINTMDEETEPARKCKASYPIVLDMLLREYPWNFATKITELALLEDIEVAGWHNGYGYPSDCLCIRRIFGKKCNPFARANYKVIKNGNAGKIILCNNENPWIEYTATSVDVSMYDSLFIDAMAWRLAAEMCFSLIGVSNHYERCMQSYQTAVLFAWNNDAKETNEFRAESSIYEDARW